MLSDAAQLDLVLSQGAFRPLAVGAIAAVHVGVICISNRRNEERVYLPTVFEIEQSRFPTAHGLGCDIPHHRWNTPARLQMPIRQLVQAGLIGVEQRAIPGNAQNRIGVLGWEPRQGLDFTFSPLVLGVVPDNTNQPTFSYSR